MTHEHLANLPHHVYRYFTGGDTLLYVGCTHDLNKRHQQHRKNAPWFSQADRRSHQTYPDRWHALIAERTAIIVNRPVFNKTHNHNYWQPEDPGLTREIHRLATNRPANAAELLADIEQRVFESQKREQLEREERLRETWRGVDDEVYLKLRDMGVTHIAALRSARDPEKREQFAAS